MRIHVVVSVILLQLLLPIYIGAQETEGLRISYIANEGVFIQAAGKKVLIDAHHFRGNPHYLPAEPGMIEKMVGGFQPFDKVDLILTTHIHADHFDAGTVARHLFNQRGTNFLSSDQMTAEIESNFENYNKIKNQVLTVTPEVGFFHEIEVAGIPVKLLGMTHSSDRFKKIQNIAYILKLGEYTILHIGDADGKVGNFEPFKLPNEGIDVVVLPYWFLTHKPFNAIVNNYIQAGRIIAAHIPPTEVLEIEKKIKAVYPNAVIFLAPGQEIRL